MAFRNHGKDEKQRTKIAKKIMKKLKKEALVKPNGRKVVIMEEDIKKYCDGTHKLPEHMMNTPVLILKKRRL